MKVNKIFGVKSITNLIYGMLLLLPMVSILSRVIYTQANPNAKDSFTKNVVEQISLIDSTNFQDGTLYTYQYKQPQTTNGNRTEYSFLSLTASQLNITQEIYNTLNHVLLTNDNRIYFSTADNSNRYDYSLTDDMFKSFTMITSFQSGLTTTFNVLLTTFKDNTLDNVFEYSLNTFLLDYDNHGIDFFSWFTNLFLNQSNNHNALYLNFCNWYMNYVLLVSSAYLLFFALMWFINYIRKLLEKSSYHDFGGF